MGFEGMEVFHKRMKTTPVEGSEGDGDQVVAGSGAENEENPEEMDDNSEIQAILQRIERFTHQVSEMLEAGKAMFNNLSAQFEERLISIHRDQVEKWQDEIKALRSLDASNQATRELLQNAQLHLFQSITEEEQQQQQLS